MSYWDSSAIVPLCLYEANSSRARRLLKQSSGRTFAWFTPVEVMSAFARSERSGNITAQRRTAAENLFLNVEKRFSVIQSEPRIIELARTFPVAFGLRALDSLQLSSALVWCKEFPKDKDFVAADARLLEAAEKTGFNVHEL